MIHAIKNMQKRGYHYTFGFIFNLAVFSAIYKLFGFEWLMVVALADITRDIGILVVSRFDERLPNEDTIL